jgi:alpha-glucosidase
LIKQAKEFGYPLVRPLFFHYPEDEKTYNINYEEFLLGPDLLVAPVLDPNTQKKEVYLPQGTWIELWTNQTYEGNNKIIVDAPLGNPPLFYKKDSSYKELFEKIRKIQ